MNILNQPNISIINNRNEINRILKSGTKVFTKFGPVFFLSKDIDTDDSLKIAILLNKKTGKAFFRNRIKRLLRYYVRTELTLLSKYNRVIFFYRSTKNTKYSNLKSEYDQSLQNIINII